MDQRTSPAGVSGVVAAAPGDRLIVELRDLHYGYEADAPVFRGLDFTMRPREVCALVGANGSGKSTLARILSGLQGGFTAARASVCGCELTSENGRREARRAVGVLFQDPENQIIGATIEDDVAFGLENIGMPIDLMRARVDEMLARFGLLEVREREPHELSGGQKQRTALAAVLALPRRLLVLDEPTAMLDADGRRELLEAATELRHHDDDLAIVYITQEMDELPAMQRVVALADGAVGYDGPPGGLLGDERLLRHFGLEPPAAVHVGRLLRARGRVLDPLPLTVSGLAAALRADGEAAGAAGGADGRERSAAGHEPTRDEQIRDDLAGDGPIGDDRAEDAAIAGVPARGRGREVPHVRAESVWFAYRAAGGPIPALGGVTIDLPPGSATALLGPSGSGKSTLLLVLRGLLDPQSGRVRVDGGATSGDHDDARRRLGLVFQRAEVQLFAQSAREDVAFGPRQFGLPDEHVDEAVDAAMRLVGLPAGEYGARHPYALSAGEQRRLALAGVLAMRPGVLLLDEPFVGLDPAGRRDLLGILAGLRGQGITLVLVTHDAAAARALCPRRVIMYDGRVIADGAWDLDRGGLDLLLSHGIEAPPLVDLWRRLGLPLDEAPTTPEAAAEALR